MIENQDLPEIVSVSFKPESLTDVEKWRLVLSRLLPRSRRPALRLAFGSVYVVAGMAYLGYLVGRAGWPGLSPESMAVAFGAAGMLHPLRLWLIKRRLIKMLEGLGPFTIELSEEGSTIRSKNRLTRIDWAGVADVRTTLLEVVLRYRAGDASWIATRLFSDLDHRDRFVQVAENGLAHARLDPVSQPTQGRG